MDYKNRYPPMCNAKYAIINLRQSIEILKHLFVKSKIGYALVDYEVALIFIRRDLTNFFNCLEVNLTAIV